MIWFKFPDGEKPSAKRLMKAYQNVFDISKEDAQIVLADLAEQSGYFKVPNDEDSMEQIARDAIKRTGFLNIIGHLSLNAEDRMALVNASRKMAE